MDRPNTNVHTHPLVVCLLSKLGAAMLQHQEEQFLWLSFSYLAIDCHFGIPLEA